MNTKKIIIFAIVALILVGCASNKPDGNKADGSTSVITGSEEPIVTTEAETIAVIPSVPAEIPDIPDSEVEFSNDFLVVQVDTWGTTYANGVVVESSAVGPMIQQAIINQSKPSNTTATKSPDATEPADDIPPNITIPEETTLPAGTIFIDDTVDKDDDDKNEDYTDIFYLGKYKKSGNTELAISDIAVFSSAKPGVEGVDKFNSEDTMLVNLLCNPDAMMNSTVYVVPEKADHATSYAPEDCLLSVDMSLAFKTSENQIFFEIELPKGIIPGVYELRFICNGIEDGYVPYHLG